MFSVSLLSNFVYVAGVFLTKYFVDVERFLLRLGGLPVLRLRRFLDRLRLEESDDIEVCIIFVISFHNILDMIQIQFRLLVLSFNIVKK